MNTQICLPSTSLIICHSHSYGNRKWERAYNLQWKVGSKKKTLAPCLVAILCSMYSYLYYVYVWLHSYGSSKESVSIFSSFTLNTKKRKIHWKKENPSLSTHKDRRQRLSSSSLPCLLQSLPTWYTHTHKIQTTNYKPKINICVESWETLMMSFCLGLVEVNPCGISL